MKVLYVSYDGALDPLGTSQITRYLTRLAGRGVDFTLLSFEKSDRSSQTDARESVAATLAESGIRWIPLRYHKRPRVPATAWDVLGGARAIRREAARAGVSLVHCRGDVAMAMARCARLPAHVRLLYDVRGFFSEERVAGGSWKADGLLDQGVRRIEEANLRRADAIVVLTQRALEVLRRRRPALPPHAVIPTAVDLDLFQPRAADEPAAYALAYAGSLGLRYDARAMATLGRLAAERWGKPVLFLTPDAAEAERAGIGPPWAEVRTVPAHEVGAWIRRAQATFFLIAPGPAACPTKFPESLACGLPVLANAGIGDLDELLVASRVGVVVEPAHDGYARALQALDGLLADPETATRCRGLAEQRYALPMAVEAYHRLYDAAV